MYAKIAESFGRKVRVRVCGLCRNEGRLLLVNHHGIVSGDWWSPPGGGIDFGKEAEQALKDEFVQETGLRVSVGKLLFVCEFINQPLHAIELFFEVKTESGSLTKGFDPELASQDQIIADARFFTMAEIRELPRSSLHGIFSYCEDPQNLENLTGFIKI